jgi:hypothetical protein
MNVLPVTPQTIYVSNATIESSCWRSSARMAKGVPRELTDHLTVTFHFYTHGTIIIFYYIVAVI